MMKRFCLSFFMTAALLVNVVSADWAPILWDTSGVNIRQGYHTEWFRAGANDPVTGDQVYTYSDCREGDRDVYAQKFDVDGNQQWDDNGLLICRNAGRQEDSEVIYSGNGNWIFAWVDYRRTPHIIEAGDVWAQKVDSDGNPLWDPIGVPVCTVDGIQISLRLVDDGAGGLMIMWEDNRNDGNDLYAQHLTASGQIAPGWPAAGIPVISYIGNQEEITVDTDGQGGAIVAWKDARVESDKDIYAQRIRPNGTLVWEADGLPICTAPFDQTSPKLCPDGNGGAYIVWLDRRIDNNFGDLYMQRVDSAGHVQYDDNGIIICDVPNEQNECRIMTASDNGAIMVWVDFRDDPQNILGDIYAQKVNLAGNILWGTNGMLVCDAVQQQMGARFTSDGAGGTIIAWEDVRDGNDVGDADIYAQRISAAGTAMWAANGVVITNAPEYQHSALLKSDLNNGAFIVWAKQATSSTQTVQSLFIQHVNSNGVAQLEANGVEFQNGINGDAKYPKFVETIPGRDLVFWSDYRYGGYGCIYVQLIDWQGNTYLEENGRSLCEGYVGGNMEDPQFVSDMMNGALVVWKDSRPGNEFRQTYAQRLDQDGNPLWTPGGVYVHDLPDTLEDEQANPFIAPDGNGGAFVVWSETVDNRIYVFAQRLDATGSLVWSDPVQVSNGTVEDICRGAVADGEGGVITTWVGGAWPAFKVYVQKLDPDGDPQWAADGLEVCPSYTGQEQSSLIADGQNGTYVVWRDKRNFIDYNVVAQHVDRSGNLLWADSGLVVCDAGSDQDHISMELDNQGNVFFLWEDFRNGDSLNLYMQKVSSDGEILCVPNGYPLCVTTFDRSYPAMTSDTEAGVYIAWEDYRSGGIFSDIYGQHITGDCEIVNEPPVMWNVNGDSIDTDLFWQKNTGIGPDGDGGVIVAWEDGRSSGKEQTYNLFLQRVNDMSTSPVGEPPKHVPLTFSLDQNYPNPFNPATRIRYSLSATSHVKLIIYDILGRQVRILQNRMVTAGSHEVIWNGKTASGFYASSGIYFYKLEAGNQSKVRKMVLLK